MKNIIRNGGTSFSGSKSEEKLIAWKDKARAPVFREAHSREKYAVNQEIEHLSLQILDLSSHDLDNHPRNHVSFKRYDKNRIHFSFFFSSRTSSPWKDPWSLKTEGFIEYQMLRRRKKWESVRPLTFSEKFVRRDKKKTNFRTISSSIKLKFFPANSRIKKIVKIDTKRAANLRRKESGGRDPLPLPLPAKAIKFSKYR